MAKRFTDTEKWKKHLLRGLPAPYKLLWLYICDDCNHAGIWEVDLEIAQIRIGEKINEKKALEFLKTKVLVFDAGRKWFIPSFISFQYKELKGTDRAQKSIVDMLLKYNLIDIDFNIVTIEEGASKPLASPCQGGKDMDKDKEQSILKTKKDKPKLELTFPCPEMEGIWLDWTDYKKAQHKETYKTASSAQIAINNLWVLADKNPVTALEIVNQSKGNLWKGFFKQKTNGQQHATTGNRPAKPLTGAEILLRNLNNSLNGTGEINFGR